MAERYAKLTLEELEFERAKEYYDGWIEPDWRGRGASPEPDVASLPMPPGERPEASRSPSKPNPRHPFTNTLENFDGQPIEPNLTYRTSVAVDLYRVISVVAPQVKTPPQVEEDEPKVTPESCEAEDKYFRKGPGKPHCVSKSGKAEEEDIKKKRGGIEEAILNAAHVGAEDVGYLELVGLSLPEALEVVSDDVNDLPKDLRRLTRDRLVEAVIRHNLRNVGVDYKEYKSPSIADMDGEHVWLWHGMGDAGAVQIAKTQPQAEILRGLYVSANVNHAMQYPEGTGSDYLVLVKADVGDLDTDEVNKPDTPLGWGLFPGDLPGMDSSATAGYNELATIISLRSVKKEIQYEVIRALQRGDFDQAEKLGARLLNSEKKKPKAKNIKLPWGSYNEEETTELIGSQVNEVHILKKDGKPVAIRKPLLGSEPIVTLRHTVGDEEDALAHDRELAASLISDVVFGEGFTPKVLIEGEELLQTAAVIEWRDGEALGWALDASSKVSISAKSCAKVALFDYLIGNTDRHGSNILLTEEGEMIPIDHGLAFPVDDPPEVLTVSDEFRSDPAELLLRSSAYGGFPIMEVKDVVGDLTSEKRALVEKACQGLSKEQRKGVLARFDLMKARVEEGQGIEEFFEGIRGGRKTLGTVAVGQAGRIEWSLDRIRQSGGED